MESEQLNIENIQQKIKSKIYFTQPKVHENGLRRKKPSGNNKKAFGLFFRTALRIEWF